MAQTAMAPLLKDAAYWLRSPTGQRMRVRVTSIYGAQALFSLAAGQPFYAEVVERAGSRLAVVIRGVEWSIEAGEPSNNF